jgi:adenosylcobyric acid synthase
MGETITDKPSPLCKIINRSDDGYFLNPKTWGTYIHGIFDNMPIIKNVIETAGGKEPDDFDIDYFKEEQYNKLAILVRQNSDMDYIYKTLL